MVKPRKDRKKPAFRAVLPRISDPRAFNTFALDQVGDAVFITDIDGIILYVNRAFEEISGYSSDEALGSKPSIIKSGMHENSVYDKLWSTIKKGVPFRHRIINRSKSGKLFYVDHTISPISDNKGKIIYFMGIWKDITKQKELESRRDILFNIVTHELKNPLSVIKAFIQLLQRKLPLLTTEKIMDYVDRAGNHIEEMEKLTEDLLESARIDTGNLALKKEKLDLCGLVEQTVRDIRHSIPQKIAVSSPPEPVFVKGDAGRIKRVLTNFITNASKYSRPETLIVVVLSVKDKQVVVSVKDKGDGIPDKDLPLVFDKYYRVVKNQRGIKTDGLGLGLYISSEIIRLHQGKIWAESREGEGSTFFFSLPVVR